MALLAVAFAASWGAWGAFRHSVLRYRAAALMGLCGLISLPLGQHIALAMHTKALSLVFAATMLLVAIRLWRQAVQHPAEAQVVRATVEGNGMATAGPICGLDPVTGRIVWTHRCALLLGSIGLSGGLVSGLLGVGGGFVIVPALRGLTPLSMQSAVATSLMTIAITSTGGVVFAFLHGAFPSPLAALPFAAGAMVGMSGGGWLAPRLAGPRLQQGFALLTIGVAALLAACTLFASDV